MSEKKDSPQAGRMTRIGRVCAAHRSLLAVVAAIVGAIVGAAAVLFNAMIGAWTWVTTGYWDYTQHIGSSHGHLPIQAWIFLLFTPVISALIYGPLISHFAPSAKGHGIPEVMLAVQQKGGYIPSKVAVVKLISSALTIGGGGSAGREGPIVQVGASLGSSFAASLRLPKERVIMLAACGSAAGIAATFHAPLAGAFFALEVILTRFTAEAFGYVVVSSVLSSLVARAASGDHPLIDLGETFPLQSLPDIGWVAILGIIAGLVGLAFSKFLYLSEDWIDAFWARIPLPNWSRPAVLSIALGGALICFPYMYGSGYPIEISAIFGSYSIPFLALLLLGRILYTSYTIGIGGSGGVFAPTLFMGAMTGMIFGQLVDPWAASQSAIFGVIGMGAAFAGAARAPMTAVLIIVEMTGQYSLIMPMMLAVIIATFVSRFFTRSTIYTEKLRRRGDVLHEPVDDTLLGRRSARQLMTAPSRILTEDMTLMQAQEYFQSSPVPCLPVIAAKDRYQELPRYLGMLTLSELASYLSRGLPPHTRISSLALDESSSIPQSARPSQVLARLSAPDNPWALAVIDEDSPTPHFLGWVTQQGLVKEIAAQQGRAIAAGHLSSWGSRWQDRHPRASRHVN